MSEAKRETEEKVDTCPDCKRNIIILDNSSGERVCASCGLVLSDIVINEGPDNHLSRGIAR